MQVVHPGGILLGYYRDAVGCVIALAVGLQSARQQRRGWGGGCCNLLVAWCLTGTLSLQLRQHIGVEEDGGAPG